MSRGKAISVKIPTQRVIAGLETALAKLEKDYATQGANEAKYEKGTRSVAQGNWQVGYC
jgi:hypothetical protein